MTDKTGEFRDDLAVKILLAWCGNANSPMQRDRDGHARLWELETLAEATYELADAMLKERGWYGT
nr:MULTISPECIES: hypothetical protein [Providencia]